MSVEETLCHSKDTNTWLLHHRVKTDGVCTYEQLRVFDGDNPVAKAIIVRKDEQNYRLQDPPKLDLPGKLDYFLN